jgi:predicted TPR repeat methyltransferase
MSLHRRSRGPAHFQRLYDASSDPWQFRTSRYEQEKYQSTIDGLGHRQFRSGFEPGCSIGVLTRLLAVRCDELLAVDVVEQALTAARMTCADQPWVRFERMQVPREWPDAVFDLIVLSEVLYFLSPTDITSTANRTFATLEAGGLVVLVNWRGRSSDPCTGDEAGQIFIERTQGWLSSQTHHQEDAYRLDVLCRR